MFRSYGISPLVYEAAQPRVELDSGGSLVIDHTDRAMTVVDVNSGSFVGEKNMEETALNVNLEAAREIARQVRLRNIGGIVVVDFIDMAEEEHRPAGHGGTDRPPRRRQGEMPRPAHERPLPYPIHPQAGGQRRALLSGQACEHCGGMGYVHADVFVVAHIRADILDRFADGYEAVVVELNEKVMRLILSERMFGRELKERWKDKRIYMIPHKTFAEGAVFGARGQFGRPAPPRQRAGTLLSAAGEGIGEMSR